jgi:hypothetical protein
LGKAVKLIDDKGALTQPTKLGKGRRKSAFAEEDEAYQFVEEGFRIRFANGETIDFYADNAADKAGWMAVFSRTVGKSAATGKAWCQLVLAHEKKAQDVKVGKSKDAVQARPRSMDGLPKPENLAKASRSVPTSPVKPTRQAPTGPQSSQQSPQARARVPAPGSSPSRRKQIQSMIF